MKRFSVSSFTRRASVAVLAITLLLVLGALPSAARSVSAPKSGGIINIRATRSPVCLDPAKAVSDAEGTVLGPASAGLLTYNLKGKLAPSLATKWKISHGGKWIDLTLRHDAHFSNGRLVDANAVKGSMTRLMKSALGAASMGPLTSVKVLSKFAVRLILKTPYRPLLNDLAANAIVDPKAAATEGDQKFCQYPVLAGPFAITKVGPSFEPVTLKRNKYYTWEQRWQPNHGRPYLNGVSVYPLTSDSTAISEMLSGQLDISGIPGDQLSRVQGNPKIILHKKLSTSTNYLFFNLDHAPFNNKEVRKAFAESIDRTAIIKAVLNGQGIPAYSLISKADLFYDKTTSKYEPKYDPADARRIFQQYHVTGPFTYVTNSIPLHTGVAELIQGELAQVGVKVNVVPKEIGAWLDALQHGQYDISFNGSGNHDPDTVLYALYNSTQATPDGYNFANVKDPTVDKLIQQGRTTLNQKKATAIYNQLQRYFATNVLIVPLYTGYSVTGVSSRIGGWTTDPFGDIQYQDLYIKH